jgi:predicted enzyme related to lactoylglutathione lyase
MQTKLGRVVILVDDYDKAFEFYEKNFFCKKIHDSTAENGRRYLHIAFTDNESTGIWFLKTGTDQQKEKIGTQTAGQPTLVIYTDNIELLYKHVRSNHIRITQDLVSTMESKFFQCLDLYGNGLTVVELIGG